MQTNDIVITVDKQGFVAFYFHFRYFGYTVMRQGLLPKCWPIAEDIHHHKLLLHLGQVSSNRIA